MIYLLEVIWYSILVLIEICWIPAVVIIGLALLGRIIGAIKKACKDKKK